MIRSFSHPIFPFAYALLFFPLPFTSLPYSLLNSLPFTFFYIFISSILSPLFPPLLLSLTYSPLFPPPSAPMSSSKLWMGARSQSAGSSSDKGLNTPYVVKFHNHFMIDEAKPLFRFDHPNLLPPELIDNSR